MKRVLCHPDGEKSCGACCGMYNHREWGEEEVRERLRRRTRAYHQEARIDDLESLRDFRAKWEDPPAVKLLTELPSCPFLGFLGDDGERVGCLVHPLQNDGIDGRDCGVYDRFICEDYLCAAHDVLRREEVDFVLAAVKDSYLYGLAITNPRFVRTLMEEVARRTGAQPGAKDLLAPAVVEAGARCFEWLRAWRFRGEDGIFGQSEVTGPLQTARRRELAPGVVAEKTGVDLLLLCLGTRCAGEVEVDQARRLVVRGLEELSEAVDQAVERRLQR